jgi:hypothetical protein
MTIETKTKHTGQQMSDNNGRFEEINVELRLAESPARILPEDMNIEDQITLDENLEREEINPIDEAFWLARLKDHYELDVAQLATKIGKSPAYVSGRLAIIEWPDFVMAALRTNEITLTTARELAKCRDEVEIERLLEIITENGASSKVVAMWVLSANQAFDRRAELPDVESGTYAESPAYHAPVLFCDLCEQPTDYMESKFVRVCPACFEVAKANLKRR